jgi:hypothetical protein
MPNQASKNAAANYVAVLYYDTECGAVSDKLKIMNETGPSL